MDWKYENGRIYSISENNELMAEATFTDMGSGKVDIDHTYVNPVLRGQGVAGKMLETVAGYIRENGLKATATCSYANSWFKKHRDEYADILADDFDKDIPACRTDGKH